MDRWHEPKIISDLGNAIAYIIVLGIASCGTLLLFGGMLCPLFWHKLRSSFESYANDMVEKNKQNRKELWQQIEQEMKNAPAEKREACLKSRESVLSCYPITFEENLKAIRRTMGVVFAIWFLAAWTFFILVIVPQIH